MQFADLKLTLICTVIILNLLSEIHDTFLLINTICVELIDQRLYFVNNELHLETVLYTIVPSIGVTNPLVCNCVCTCMTRIRCR